MLKSSPDRKGEAYRLAHQILAENLINDGIADDDSGGISHPSG